MNTGIRGLLSFAAVFFSLTGFGYAASADTVTVLDQEFSQGTGSSYNFLGSAQTFTVGQSGQLERVDLDMRAGYGTLYLQPVFGGLPDPDPSHALAVRNVGYNGGDWLPVNLSNVHLQVTSGDMFGLLVIGSNQLYWGGALDTEGNYPGGHAYQRVFDINTSGYTYREFSAFTDFNFKTYVSTQAPVTVTPEPLSGSLFALGLAALGLRRRFFKP